MYRKYAYVAAVVFLLVGILGFIPGITTKDDMGMPLLVGLFMVGVVHNIIHLLSGVAAWAAGAAGERAARTYFQVFGIIYGLVTIIGFIQGHTVLGIFPVNLADNLLHLVLAVAGLIIGFALPARREADTHAPATV